MNARTAPATARKTVADYKAELAQLNEEMDELLAKMERRQWEFDRRYAESQTNRTQTDLRLAEIKKTLDRLQRLD